MENNEQPKKAPRPWSEQRCEKLAGRTGDEPASFPFAKMIFLQSRPPEPCARVRELLEEPAGAGYPAATVQKQGNYHYCLLQSIDIGYRGGAKAAA